jgi:hypothetical protein
MTTELFVRQKNCSASGSAITTGFFARPKNGCAAGLLLKKILARPKNCSASGCAMTTEFCIWMKKMAASLVVPLHHWILCSIVQQ